MLAVSGGGGECGRVCVGGAGAERGVARGGERRGDVCRSGGEVGGKTVLVECVVAMRGVVENARNARSMVGEAARGENRECRRTMSISTSRARR